MFVVLRFSFVLFAVPIVPFSELAATPQTHCHSVSRGAPKVPISVTGKPISVLSGIGLVHERVATTSESAQTYYNQGLTLLYAYQWIDAARSFKEALRRDPKLAMAHLGLSYAFSGLADDAEAVTEENRAQRLERYAGKQDAIRIELRRTQLQSIQAEAQGRTDAQYIDGLDKALAADPHNPQLLLLRGNASEGSAQGIGQRGAEVSMYYYKQLLKSDPENPVPHHFLTHSYEMLNNIDEAAKQAAAFLDRTPRLPHAHHMYGHELLRAGRIREAVTQFEEADWLEEKAFQTNPAARIYDWHYRHNLNLLAAAYRQAGMSGRAEAVLRKLAMLPTLSAADEYYQAQFAAFLVQNGKYAAAVRETRKHREASTDFGLVLQHVILGSALASSGSTESAAAQLLVAERSFAALDSEWQISLKPWIEILKAQVEIRQSRMAIATQRLLAEAQAARTSFGTDAWSDALFHLEHIANIAYEARLWDTARFAAQRLKALAPGYYGHRKVLANIQEGQSGPVRNKAISAGIGRSQ